MFTLQDEVVSNIIDALVGNGDILSKEVSKVGLTATAQNLDSLSAGKMGMGTSDVGDMVKDFILTNGE